MTSWSAYRHPLLPWIVAGSIVLGCIGAQGALAFENGDQCALKAPLQIKIRTKRGSVEATLEKGTDVSITMAGDEGLTIVRAGETNGAVVTIDLEAACAGSLRYCTLRDPVTMYEKNRSDSRSFRIKEGASVSLLKKGKTWAAVRIEDLQGFVDAREIARNCKGAPLYEDGAGYDASVDTLVEDVERGDGPGVLLVPFSLEGNAPAGAADGAFQMLWERITIYRPDAAKTEDDGNRRASWKAYVDRSAGRAKAADMRYVVVGRLFIDETPPPAGTVAAESYALQLGVVDARTGRMLKGVRVKPSTRLDDPWPDNVLSKLLPEIAGAPGARLPDVGRPARLEIVPNSGGAPAPPGPTPLPQGTSAPWFANPLGFAVLGVAVLAGGGGGVLAWLALAENDAANAIPATQSARAERRDSALIKGALADGLAALAVVSAVGGVVVFATRTGME